MGDCKSGIYLDRDQFYTFLQELADDIWGNSDEAYIFNGLRFDYDKHETYCLDEIIEKLNELLSELVSRNGSFTEYDRDRVLGESSFILTASEGSFAFDRVSLPPLVRFAGTTGHLDQRGFITYLTTLGLGDQQNAVEGLTWNQQNELFSAFQDVSDTLWGDDSVHVSMAELFKENEFDLPMFVNWVTEEFADKSPQEQLVIFANLIDASPEIAGLALGNYISEGSGSSLHYDLLLLTQWMNGAYLDVDGLLSYLTTLSPEEQARFVIHFQQIEDPSQSWTVSWYIRDYLKAYALYDLLTNADLQGKLEVLMRLDEVTRQLLGLPSNAEIMKTIFELIGDSTPDVQANFARGYLNVWNKEGEQGSLGALQNVIDGMPETVLGLSVASIKQAYQLFHDTIQMRWDLYVTLQEMVDSFHIPGEPQGETSLDVRIGETIGRGLNWAIEQAPDAVEDYLRDGVLTIIQDQQTLWNYEVQAAYYASPFADGVLDATGFYFISGVANQIANGNYSVADWLLESTQIGRENFWNFWGSSFDYQRFLKYRNTLLGDIGYWSGFGAWSALTLGLPSNYLGSRTLNFPMGLGAEATMLNGQAVVIRTIVNGQVVIRVVRIPQAITALRAGSRLGNIFFFDEEDTTPQRGDSVEGLKNARYGRSRTNNPADKAYEARVTGKPDPDLSIEIPVGTTRPAEIDWIYITRDEEIILVDAKHTPSGNNSWYNINTPQVTELDKIKAKSILDEAERQLRAVKVSGADAVEWWVSDKDVADALRKFFESQAKDITVKYVP